MTQTELWIHYIQKNPHWLKDGAKLTPTGLKKLVEQTWEVGFNVGHKETVSEQLFSGMGFTPPR